MKTSTHSPSKQKGGVEMRKRGDPFEPGYEIDSLSVIAVVSQAQKLCSSVYRVKHSACGHESEVTHKSILQRRSQKHSGLCTECGNVRQARNMVAARAAKRKINSTISLREKDSVESKLAVWAHKRWPIASGFPVVY